MIPFRHYIVFGFNSRPQGGFNDIRGSYDSLEEIEDLITEDFNWYFFDNEKYSSYQVFDRVEGVMIRLIEKYPGFLT